jgi:hypothetical protein
MKCLPKLLYPNFFFLSLILFIITPKVTISWETQCNQQGKCLIFPSSKTSNYNNSYELLPGKCPSNFDKSEFTRSWNKTNTTLEISGQIDGVSRYRPLPGKKGYECSGGISECINSCCLDGFCVAILHYCHHQIDTINLTYIITVSFFVLLIVIYWTIYIIIGCNFNEQFKSDNCDEIIDQKEIDITNKITSTTITMDTKKYYDNSKIQLDNSLNVNNNIRIKKLLYEDINDRIIEEDNEKRKEKCNSCYDVNNDKDEKEKRLNMCKNILNRMKIQKESTYETENGNCNNSGNNIIHSNNDGFINDEVVIEYGVKDIIFDDSQHVEINNKCKSELPNEFIFCKEDEKSN